jgi:hypothetical protein
MLSAGQYRDVGASGVTARTVESAGTASRLGRDPQACRFARPKHVDRSNRILRLSKPMRADTDVRASSYLCISMMAEAGIMFALRCAMIHSDPETMRATTSTPKASASTLLVLSAPVLICRKNTK